MAAKELRNIGLAIDDIAKSVGRAVRVVKLKRRLGDIDLTAREAVEGKTLLNALEKVRRDIEELDKKHYPRWIGINPKHVRTETK